jgi:hypothetical protein
VPSFSLVVGGEHEERCENTKDLKFLRFFIILITNEVP